MLTVSLCMIAYNEEKTIHYILKDFLRQTYPHERIEVVLIDNNSSDNTGTLMQKFALENRDFKRITVKKNGSRSQASGWNAAIKESREDVIIRIDAHASIPENFVYENIKCLESGESVCGGPRPNIIDERTLWKETLLLAESSMFGSSVADFRRTGEKKYVKSMFHAAYKKEVFEQAGCFDERLGRTEDNELHYRIRQTGFRLCYSPDIISYQHIRNSLVLMLKQKFLNGYWIGLTTGVCPRCLSSYHFVPFAFIMAVLITTIGCAGIVFTGTEQMLRGVIKMTEWMWIIYAAAAVTMAFMAVITAKKEQRNISNIMLPFLFLGLHLSYGAGTLIGLIQMPAFVKGIRKNGTDKKR